MNAERIDSRHDVYAFAAQAIGRQPDFHKYKFHLVEARSRLAVEAAFLLNDAFKKLRFENPEHGSEPPKVAAFLSLAVCQVLPFQPGAPIDTEMAAYSRANAMYAMRLACGLIGHPVEKRSEEGLLRIYDRLMRERVSAIDEIVEATRSNSRAVGDVVEMGLTRDEMGLIQNRISMFEVLAGMPIYKR